VSDQEDIHIKTERDTEGVVRVVWSDGNQRAFLPYRLYVQEVQRKANVARAALGHLFKEYYKIHPDFTTAVRLVAEKGKDLRDALFYDCPPEDRYLAAEPRDWFTARTKDPTARITLTVHAEPILQLPWGLLHEEPPPHNPNEDMYDGFWACRYTIVTLYRGSKPSISSMARQHDKMKLISALHQTVFEQTKGLLDQRDELRVNAFLQWPVGAFSTDGLRERWGQVGENDCLIHFFGHASGTELQFSDSDVLTASEFRSLFRRESGLVAHRGAPSYVLAVLNGCATVAGRDAESFLVATADAGFCGFIGAEAPVPNDFALLFGQDLLDCLLLESKSVRETMSSLWSRHKPMALLYGCYAHPDFRVTSPADDTRMPPAFKERNLSYTGCDSKPPQ